MPDGEKKPNLGLLLKSLMKERSLSMRKLSALTEIDTASISRIISGKQTARLQQIDRFADCLSVPIEQLLDAAGIKIGNPSKEEKSDLHSPFRAIHEVLESFSLFDPQYTTERVEQELSKYEQYAQTEEGERIIREEFQEKVQQVAGIGPFIEHLQQMHSQFTQGNVTPEERALLGSALLYFILSTDIIPDYIFPIGYLDDAIAVQLILNRLSRIKNALQQKENEEI